MASLQNGIKKRAGCLAKQLVSFVGAAGHLRQFFGWTMLDPWAEPPAFQPEVQEVSIWRRIVPDGVAELSSANIFKTCWIKSFGSCLSVYSLILFSKYWILNTYAIMEKMAITSYGSCRGHMRRWIFHFQQIAMEAYVRQWVDTGAASQTHWEWRSYQSSHWTLHCNNVIVKHS
jgi:hypothetical protein